MYFRGYEIPRRLLVLLALLLVVVAGAAAYLAGVGPLAEENDTAVVNDPERAAQQAAAQAPVVGQQAVDKLEGSHLTLKLEKGKMLKDYAVFATVTRKQGQPLWTQRLEVGKPVAAKLEEGDYVVSIAFSPCKGNCDVFHGGVGLAPVEVKGASDATLTIVPDCQKVDYAPGVECSATKVNRAKSENQ